MSGAIKNRIWSQLWEPAYQSLTGTPLRRCPRSSSIISPDVARKAFQQSRASFSTVFTRRPSRKQITRKFASSGILLFGLNPSSTTTNSALTSCSNVIEKSLSTKAVDRRQISPIARWGWMRAIHTSRPRYESEPGNRSKPSSAEGPASPNPNNQASISKDPAQAHVTPKPRGDSAFLREASEHPESHSLFHLPHLPHLPNLPKLPHRPTKEELLAAATGFWSRLRVHFKWFSIRSLRPWNIDDWSAFASWLLVGHILWILVGTTTFVSLLILGINTVVAQETLARWVGDYLTRSAGVKIVFENAIVPRWRDGVITFRNVFVSRRPGQGKSKITKGSQMDAAAAAAAERQADAGKVRDEEQDDGNYTQFDVTIDTVNVTLSFIKWWNGKGLLRDVEVKGVRGVVDRTSVQWPREYVDPRTYKHEHNVGDFEIDNFKLEDLLLTIHQPGGFRPFAVSVFSCDLPKFRKQWLFYDILSANQISGSFDGSLFNIHPRQTHSPILPYDGDTGASGETSPWKKHNRLRLDGLKIDHLNRGVDGPFGWIYEGNVDIVADIMIPVDNDDSITKVMSEIYERFEATLSSHRYSPYSKTDATEEQKSATKETKAHNEDDKRFLVMDVRVHLNDVRAAVPLFTRDLTYINQALIRPIVAYINSRKTFIPINCRIVKRATDFDGSWTIFDSGLMEDLSAETYEAFAKDVVDRQARIRRLKKVGFWSLSVAAQALFMGLAGNIA